MKAEQLMKFGETVEEHCKEDPMKALLAAALCLMDATAKFAKVHNRQIDGKEKPTHVELTDDYKKTYNELMEASQVMAITLFFSKTNASDLFLKSQGYVWTDDGDIVKTN
jgi:hypothetical protein